MKLPALNPNTRTITMLAAAAAALLFVGVFAYTACSHRLNVASAELQNKQKQVEDSKKIAWRLNDARDGYLKAQNELKFLETSVSTSEYVPTLLKQIERLAKSYNLKVVSIRPTKAPPPTSAAIKRTSEDPQAAPETASKTGAEAQKAPEKPKPYDELKIDMEFDGKYWDARGFMYSLTSFPKIIAVNQLSAGPGSGILPQKRSPNLLVHLTVTAFVFRDAATAVKEAVPAEPAATTKANADIRRPGNEG